MAEGGIREGIGSDEFVRRLESIQKRVNTAEGYRTGTSHVEYSSTRRGFRQNVTTTHSGPIYEFAEQVPEDRPVNGARSRVRGFGQNVTTTHSGPVDGAISHVEEANCSSSDSISHGSFIYTQNGRKMQSEKVYECKSGYILNGNKKRVCRADKRWHGVAPTCEVFKCGKAGDIASIKQQAIPLTIGRSVNAKDANENSWPWHALITCKGTTQKESLQDNRLLGGGSNGF